MSRITEVVVNLVNYENQAINMDISQDQILSQLYFFKKWSNLVKF